MKETFISCSDDLAMANPGDIIRAKDDYGDVIVTSNSPERKEFSYTHGNYVSKDLPYSQFNWPCYCRLFAKINKPDWF